MTPIALDITSSSSIAAAAEKIEQETGERGLFGLVNNAGIAVSGPLEILPIENIRRQFEVNVFGHLAVTQAVLPMLRAAKGRLVNIGSVNGAIAPPYMGPYAASKFALEALTDALRLELPRPGALRFRPSNRGRSTRRSGKSLLRRPSRRPTPSAKRP